MPDLKTELTAKVLPVINNLDDLSFEDNVKAPDSVVKQVFECVKQFGPCTASHVSNKLNVQSSNIQVRLRSLLDRGFVQRTKNQPGPHLYAAIKKEYVVMSSAERVAKMNAQRQALKAAGLTPKRKKKAAPPQVARRHDVMSYPTPKAPQVVPAPAPADDIDAFINSLTVADALKLRNKLNEMFGLS